MGDFELALGDFGVCDLEFERVWLMLVVDARTAVDSGFGFGFFGHGCGVVVTWHAASLGLVLGYLLGCRLVLMGLWLPDLGIWWALGWFQVVLASGLVLSWVLVFSVGLV